MFDQHVVEDMSNHNLADTTIQAPPPTKAYIEQAPPRPTPVIPTSTIHNNTTTIKPYPTKKKRDGSSLRKAPGAPKRFKSSYILFFMEKQKEIKNELGEGASVGS